ncbi:PIN domain nuclease [Candidatus Daviesbacteria bacterium]|nr:PIN domain nuclease [Candidatus Daviesbacteria bacterium]
MSALIFGSFTAIFALLLPSENRESQLVRIFLTAAVALVGFLIFPDMAKKIQVFTLRFFNFVITKLSSEVTTQLIRIRPNFSLSSPFPQAGSVTLVKPIILDTSAIIDGRVLDIAKASFLTGLILIPRFVLTELQQVADSADDLKRGRGRRGFEMIEELKKVKWVKLQIWDKDQKGKSVDEKLMNLAKSLSGKIITTDFNLNRVASLANIAILNVNDLANALKTITLPGEKLSIKIVHIGKDSKQGVGYLEDGTMVVVAGGAQNLGRTIESEVTKVLQIPAGRMIFAK